MRIKVIVLALLALGTQGLISAAPDQECASTVFGGIIGPGNYAGAGGDCNAAQSALETNMGMTKPDCDPCPPNERGCTPKCVPDDSGGSITWGNCFQDPVTGLWVKPASVSASTTWDKVCTSCKPVLPH